MVAKQNIKLGPRHAGQVVTVIIEVTQLCVLHGEKNWPAAPAATETRSPASTSPVQASATAEATHRDHAIIEQVIADLKDSALAHLPSGVFTANAAWLVCATIAHNLTRAAGALASTFHARARTATLRAHLINTPGRIARSAGQLVLHLPEHWPWEGGLDELFRRALHDPLPIAG